MKGSGVDMTDVSWLNTYLFMLALNISIFETYIMYMIEEQIWNVKQTYNSMMTMQGM